MLRPRLMIWRSKYKSLLNCFLGLSPPPHLSHWKPETETRIWVQTVCFGGDFYKQDLEDGERERERVKSIVKKHSWNHSYVQQGSVSLGPPEKHPECSLELSPWRIGYWNTYLLSPIPHWLRDAPGNINSTVFQDVGSGWSGQLSAQGKSENTWNCTLQL